MRSWYYSINNIYFMRKSFITNIFNLWTKNEIEDIVQINLLIFFRIWLVLEAWMVSKWNLLSYKSLQVKELLIKDLRLSR